VPGADQFGELPAGQSTIEERIESTHTSGQGFRRERYGRAGPQVRKPLREELAQFQDVGGCSHGARRGIAPGGQFTLKRFSGNTKVSFRIVARPLGQRLSESLEKK
jgi:hypothetical protein